MRHFLFIPAFILFSISLLGQNEASYEKGTVSYVSSQNVYVKFESTESIAVGDTLYFSQSGQMKPALVVSNKSSISCVCNPLAAESIKVSDEIFARKPVVKGEEKPQEEKPEVRPPAAEEPIQKEEPQPMPSGHEEQEGDVFKQKIKGRLSVGSYNNLSDNRDNYRMQYAFSLRGDNIGNSRFSTDDYIVFRHTSGEWDEVKNNLANALKVYSLSARYDLDKTSSITLGRKINPKISSMGAIDGVQFEKGMGNFMAGAIAGSRPDYQDYGVNFNLFQAGAYVGHVSGKDQKYQQSTLGFIEQRNDFKTDRRFVYFQHSDALLNNLNVFASFELDLFENIHDNPKSTLNLTNLYLSLRYKLSRKLSVSAAYDNRKNVIYYESFKNYIDNLIEQETRQGMRFNFNYRPMRFMVWGVNVNWRFQKSDLNVSKNLNSYLTYSRVPVLNASATLTANFLQTGYLNSRIFGLRITKDIIPGKLNGELSFRMVDYDYKTYEYSTHQNIAGVNLTFRLTKKLGLYVYYEGIFDSGDNSYTLLNAKVIQRF